MRINCLLYSQIMTSYFIDSEYPFDNNNPSSQAHIPAQSQLPAAAL
jgi:hypothetical protein